MQINSYIIFFSAELYIRFDAKYCWNLPLG